ncbi:signal peptidase complex-like protein DTM1 [Zingiber officinale]|uniref:signal peptidase complex-like protein DTM1 n=1 Tax=Zingiber officinale TaxID=94328 RepID=UPI001C4C5E6C|nr:signal peptidase complex-like protein DTM1 [Zingiber officinale]
MRRETALQTSLLSLAVLMAVLGMCTLSLKKMLGTYAFGIVGIGGILLPDWEFFDRDFSEWFKPMTVRRTHADSDNWRFNLYPLRVTMLTLIYSFGIYKWWMFISS